jgi:hypothetical protein
MEMRCILFEVWNDSLNISEMMEFVHHIHGVNYLGNKLFDDSKWSV